MSPDLERAEALQARLAAHARQVAELIAVPALERDIDAVAAEWDAIERLKAPLGTVYRKLRKTLHQTGKGLQTRALDSEIKAIGHVLRLWEEIGRIVAKHIAAPEAPLALDLDPKPHDALIRHIHDALHILANPNEQDPDAREQNCFADIAMDIQSFEQMMAACRRLLLVQGRVHSARFLDIGCGGGTKVFAAARHFARCDGLEYDPGYARAGQRTLSLIMPGQGEVFEGDALTFENYGDYDVIYFYRPINDHDLLEQMQARVVEQARPGTLIVAPYNRELEPREPYPGAQITGPIFATGIGPAQAEHWHANARRTDIRPIRRPDDLRFDPGPWRVVLEAASYNGATRLARKLLPEDRPYRVFTAAVT